MLLHFRCSNQLQCARKLQDFATAAPMVPEPTGVLRQSTAGLIRFMSTLSLYCTEQHSITQPRPLPVSSSECA